MRLLLLLSTRGSTDVGRKETLIFLLLLLDGSPFLLSNNSTVRRKFDSVSGVIVIKTIFLCAMLVCVFYKLDNN
jgi:hypothetical protein